MASYWDWLPVELQDKIQEYASLLYKEEQFTYWIRHFMEYGNGCNVRVLRKSLYPVQREKALFTFGGF